MKKIILILGMSLIAFGQSVAMSSDSDITDANVNAHHGKDNSKHHKQGKAGYVHKLVDIYANDNSAADKVSSIKFKERDDYNIFFCKENNWCEVVNKKDGKTGWINLDELKKVQEKYVQVTQKEADFNKLAQYMQLQDQKIIQLQTVIMQMQKEFSTVLQNQQSQINQLQQSSYY